MRQKIILAHPPHFVWVSDPDYLPAESFSFRAARASMSPRVVFSTGVVSLGCSSRLAAGRFALRVASPRAALAASS